MRYLIITLLSLTAVSCSRIQTFDAEAATKWSQTADVQNRKKASLYSFQRPDGSWVAISTSSLKEEGGGLVYDGGEILRNGYLVYPGGKRVASIKEAIDMASTLP